jgi:hypothetical protein
MGVPGKQITPIAKAPSDAERPPVSRRPLPSAGERTFVFWSEREQGVRFKSYPETRRHRDDDFQGRPVLYVEAS